MGITNGISNFIASIIENQRANKAVKSILKQNESNQGIIYYQPSDVEAFFNESESISNMLISGGAPIIRNKSIVRFIECGFVQQYATILIHCGNQALEQMLDSVFGQNLFIINKDKPLFEPIKGKNDIEICKLFTTAAPSKCRVGPAGRNYLNGMLNFMHAKGINPYSRMFIDCPHLKLYEIINQAEAKGTISSSDAQTILSLLTQGESERNNIEEFFYSLNQQGENILAHKQDNANSTNCVESYNNGQVISIDVLSWTNDILINLIINEVETLLSQGIKAMIVFSELNSVENDYLSAFIRKSGGNLSIAIASDDSYSSFAGSDNDFFSFAGKCSKIIISKHSSAYSCQKLSDIIGTYEKQDISTSIAQSNNYSVISNFGVTQTTSISAKRENIVKPDEIQRMPVDVVYLIDKLTGQISWIPVI